MSNEIKTRPLTPTEQKYTYAQSMQLEGQTGTIGHLRGDFATTGYGFYTTWFDTRPQWKSDEFKADLDTVINALREDKGLLHIITDLSSQIILCLIETEPEKLLFMVVFQQNTKHSYLHWKISYNGMMTK